MATIWLGELDGHRLPRLGTSRNEPLKFAELGDAVSICALIQTTLSSSMVYPLQWFDTIITLILERRT